MKNLKKPARLPRKAPSNQTGGTAWGKKLAAEISRMAQAADMKKLILLNFPYIIAFYMVEKAAWLYRHCNGDSVVDRLMVLFMNFGLAYKSVLPSFHPFDLMVGLVGAAVLKAVIYFKGKNAKKYRQGEEYGSARWGNQKDIEPFIDPVFENNVILTQTERLMMSGRPKHPKYARNKNVIVIGGSGSGKTRFYVKPNLMQMPQKVSYVVTDPKGSIGVECGEALLKHGYKLKFFNSINFSKSMKYNPMAYIHSEKDILKLVTALMTNTKGEGQGGDPFWDKAERLLLVSLIAYLHYEAPVEEQNFATLLEMLNTMQVSEDDETYQNPVDLLFEDLGKKKPKSFAVRQYKLYKLAAGKTAKSILISCGARLAPFDIQEVRDATMYDELELDKLGDRKTALFLIMSDTDSTFNFLISMIYTQLFNLLCDKADDVYGGKLPIHVRCLIDECANIGQIPQLEKLVATIRSREISACLVLQTRSQLKAIYKDNADTIVGNMDSQIFLGGSEPTTLKDLAEALGKETIDSYNNSDTRGNSPSRAFHEMKLEVNHEFDIFGQMEFYETLWEGTPSIYKDYEKTKENVLSLKPYIDAHTGKKVLTHIDAVPDNFLFVKKDGKEEIRLIDWEYAGMQDPHVDVAMFCIYSLYNKRQVDRLIAAYFTEGCDNATRIKIYCYIAACGLLWSNWCEYKRNLGVEFGEYSLRQYRYAKDYYRIVQDELKKQQGVE